MAKRTKKNITLGSGKAYIMEYSGTMPEVTAICVDENLLGKIQGGAELTYTTETHEERDDLGTVAKVVITARREAPLQEVAAKIREAGGETGPVRRETV